MEGSSGEGGTTIPHRKGPDQDQSSASDSCVGRRAAHAGESDQLGEARTQKNEYVVVRQLPTGLIFCRTDIPHATHVVLCAGPDKPHAFDIIPLQPRNGALDALCPVCRGHGQWNAEIDLVSFRCKRAICERCYGAGCIETGNDRVGHPDIIMTAEGYPKWVIGSDPAPATTAKVEKNVIGTLFAPRFTS